MDRTTDIDRGADGGFASVIQHYGAGYDLQRTEAQTVSADGRTSTLTIDRDGDGFVDQRVESVIDLSGNVTTTYEDVEINGIVPATVTSFEAANGMQMSYAFDVDGDGAVDITRANDISYGDNGEMISTFSETYGTGTLVYQETTTTAADGLSYISTFDVEGDGVVDGTTTSTTTLNGDGSRETLTETVYTNGDLHSLSFETVSADGRITTSELDYDGNGIADKVSETVIASDGKRVNTESSFNEAGIHNNTFITTTSADGLTTTVLRQGNVQTTTRSVIDNGSYDWDNGIASGTNGHLSTQHQIDALGVETWTMNGRYVTYNANGDPVVEVVAKSARLDAEAKARLFTEAESIFDAVLDRGLDTSEREDLIRWVEDGQLDKTALIDHLLDGGEFTTRYGTITDAEFVTQMTMNAFGRAPSMTELAEYLYQLGIGYRSRAEIAMELADSSEHQVVGNTHMRTNNFDVIMNNAVFERSLDKAYVETVITNLVDVVYDRDPTAQELSYLSELLLEGDKQPEDIATILLGVKGDIQGIASVSLNGLSGTALVEQAYLNALGRGPTTAESNLWTSNISGNVITAAQFVASLAQSTEHLEVGNGHVATALPNETLRTGSAGYNNIGGGAGIDHFTGSTGSDEVDGEAGSDIFVWRKGDGNLRIEEEHENPTETDTLILSDTLASEVSLRHTDNGDNLYVDITTTGESINIVDRFDDGDQWRGVEAIEFADGEIWHVEDILARTMTAGGTGNDTLDGSNYDDNLFGLAGNDTLRGYLGDDTLEGGSGADTLNGGMGSDTYHWTWGDGDDSIDEETGSADGLASYLTDIDTLVMEGVLSTEVTLTRGISSTEVKNDLFVNVAGSGPSAFINVWDQFDQAGEGLEQIVFADGVVWDRQDIIERATLDGTSGNNTITGLASDDNIHGHDGNDTLNGGNGDDVLIGGLGNDTLKGGIGGDTYIWRTGDGDDLINEENNTDLTHIDRLIVEDVASTDVSFYRENHSDGERRNDLYISINGTATIEAYDQFKTKGEGLEFIEFADGIVWGREDILSRTRLEGTSGDDTGWTELNGSSVRDNLYGLAGNDTIDAGSGDDWLYGEGDDDTLYGDAGNDTYVYREGDGNDLIIDTSATDAETDTLLFTDIASNGAELTKVGDDLIVTINATNEKITVRDRFDVGFNGQGEGIEFIQFSDDVIVEVLGGALAETIITGTVANETLSGWGLVDTIYGGDGNDKLEGKSGDDTLIGESGVDELRGGNGNDTYIWLKGDGNDSIRDFTGNTYEVDTLIFTDVLRDGVELRRQEGSAHLEITVLATGEVIEVRDRYSNSNDDYGIEEIIFADGIVWNLSDIRTNTNLYDANNNGAVNGTNYDDNLYGLEGNDEIAGFAGDDHLIGGVGNDRLEGGAGNDTYVWSYGDGNDRIDDRVAGAADTDTLLLNDVLSADVTLFQKHTSNGKRESLFVAINGPAGSYEIDIYDQFEDPYEGIEAIAFADGERWTLSDIQANTWLTGTDGANSYNGLSVRDNIRGLDGNDTLKGLGGDDYLHGDAGDDVLEGGDGNDTLYGGDGNDTLNGGLGEDVLFGGAGNDTLIGHADADSFDGGEGIDTVDFGYSTFSNIVDLTAGIVDWSSTTGGIEAIINVENVIGSSGDNTIIGDGADNRLEGRDGDDVISGGDGADMIIGGEHDDTLTGGDGADTFVFYGGDEDDSITDFEDGIDLLDFSQSNLSFGDLTITTLADGSTLVEHGTNESITIHNSSGLIDQTDFLF